MPDLILTEELQSALARLLKQAAGLLGASTVRHKLVSNAVRDMISAKQSAGVRPNSIASLSCSLNSFCAACPKSISTITQEDVEAWLAMGDLKPKTRKNRLVDLKGLFAWCMKRGLLDRNPTDGVEVPRIAFKAVEIIPVGDVEKLLHACQKSDPALLGYLALILFGGLRSKESARAMPQNVHDGIVDIGGEQTKLNVRRCFPIQPTLARWLAVPGVEIGGKNIYNRFRQVQKLAAVKIPDNGLRHTCASNFLQILGVKDAARMLGHSESMLYAHYAAKVTPEAAQQFLNLKPLP